MRASGTRRPGGGGRPKTAAAPGPPCDSADPRLPAAGWRTGGETVHGTRYTVHGTRYTVHRTRCRRPCPGGLGGEGCPIWVVTLGGARGPGGSGAGSGGRIRGLESACAMPAGGPGGGSPPPWAEAGAGTGVVGAGDAAGGPPPGAPARGCRRGRPARRGAAEARRCAALRPLTAPAGQPLRSECHQVSPRVPDVADISQRRPFGLRPAGP